MAFDQRLAHMWRALPILPGDQLPRNTAIKSSFVTSMMANCWQLVWHENDQLIIHHEGENVDAMWGDTPTGEDYLANYSPDRKAALLKFYQTLFDQPCGATIVRKIDRNDGQHHELTTNFVPLLDSEGKQRILFGTSEMDGNFKSASGGRLNFDRAVPTFTGFIDLGFGLPD